MTGEKKEEKMLIDRLKPSAEREVTVISPELRERVDIYQIAAEMFKEEGVEYTFGVTGGGSFEVEIPSQKLGIPRVHMRHEQAATFAADAWGRITRRPAVAIIGSGIGMAYATAGVTQAYCAGSPAVVVQGQSGMEQEDRFPSMGLTSAEHQYAGISKWTRRVGNPRSFMWQLKRAFRSAVTHPTGPCVVAHPSDMGGGAAFSRPRQVSTIFFFSANCRITLWAALWSSQKSGWADCFSSEVISFSLLAMSKMHQGYRNSGLQIF